MAELHESGTDLELSGKSGNIYKGRIYSDKQGQTALNEKTMVCLSNSYYSDGTWHHQIRDIYDMDRPQDALDHFKIRDDISHLILIPRRQFEIGVNDLIDDLRRQYIHG